MNLHEALKVVKSMVEGGRVDACSGICFALRLLGVDVYLGRYPSEVACLFRSLCAKWPKYSGEEGYPVPSPDPSGKAVWAFYEAKDAELMWKGEYGALRMELLDFLIQETQP